MHLLVNALILSPERSNNKPAESISLDPVATDPPSICSGTNSSVVRSKSNSTPVESVGVEGSFGLEQLFVIPDHQRTRMIHSNSQVNYHMMLKKEKLKK